MKENLFRRCGWPTVTRIRGNPLLINSSSALKNETKKGKSVKYCFQILLVFIPFCIPHLVLDEGIHYRHEVPTIHGRSISRDVYCQMYPSSSECFCLSPPVCDLCLNSTQPCHRKKVNLVLRAREGTSH